MAVLRKGSISLLFLMIAVTGFAQSAEPAEPAQKEPVVQNESASQETPAAPRMRRRNYGQPCWKQAGMTPDMVNQRWKIEDQQKTSIAGVCSEPSSPQQKHDKIEQIQANTKQSIAKLIPADTLAKFNKCQADVEKNRPATTSKKQLGPCGGVIPNTAGSEHDHGSMKMDQ